MVLSAASILAASFVRCSTRRTGIGAPVRRVEDKRFLKGEDRFVDDVRPPNVAFAYVVRSPHASAKIASIDAHDAFAVALQFVLMR